MKNSWMLSLIWLCTFSLQGMLDWKLKMYDICRLFKHGAINASDLKTIDASLITQQDFFEIACSASQDINWKRSGRNFELLLETWYPYIDLNFTTPSNDAWRISSIWALVLSHAMLGNPSVYATALRRLSHTIDINRMFRSRESALEVGVRCIILRIGFDCRRGDSIEQDVLGYKAALGSVLHDFGRAISEEHANHLLKLCSPQFDDYQEQKNFKAYLKKALTEHLPKNLDVTKPRIDQLCTTFFHFKHHQETT